MRAPFPFFVVCFCLFAAASSRSRAQAVLPASQEPSVTGTLTYVSQYLFRGRRLGGESFEPSVELSAGGWALGLWTNFPIAGKVPGQSDPEIDPYGSFTFAVNPVFSVQPGFTLYTYPRAPADRGYRRTTFEPNFAVNYTIAGVRLTPRIYYDVVVRGLTYELSANCAVPLASLGTEFDLSGFAGEYRVADYANHSPSRVRTGGGYWQVGGSVPLALGSRSRLILGWAYARGAGAFVQRDGLPRSANPEAVGRGVASVSFSRTF